MSNYCADPAIYLFPPKHKRYADDGPRVVSDVWITVMDVTGMAGLERLQTRKSKEIPK